MKKKIFKNIVLSMVCILCLFNFIGCNVNTNQYEKYLKQNYEEMYKLSKQKINEEQLNKGLKQLNVQQLKIIDNFHNIVDKGVYIGLNGKEMYANEANTKNCIKKVYESVGKEIKWSDSTYLFYNFKTIEHALYIKIQEGKPELGFMQELTDFCTKFYTNICSSYLWGGEGHTNIAYRIVSDYDTKLELIMKRFELVLKLNK